MTLNELECFLDLAQTLNFSVTAERLNCSQPVISRSIRNLEADLGVILVDRSVRRRIRLTTAGAMLKETLESCRQAWETSLEAIRRAQGVSQIAFYLYADQILPEAVRRHFDDFWRRYPANSPIFRSAPAASGREILADGHFLIKPAFADVQGNYDSVRVWTGAQDRLKLICSVHHPAAKKILQSGEAVSRPENGDACGVPEVLRPDPGVFAGSPLFLPADLTKDMIHYYRKVYAELIGDEPEWILVDEPNSLFMYLMSGIGVTISTSWYAWLNDPRLFAMDLPREIQYEICWNPEKPHPPWALAFAKTLGRGKR